MKYKKIAYSSFKYWEQCQRNSWTKDLVFNKEDRNLLKNQNNAVFGVKILKGWHCCHIITKFWGLESKIFKAF